MTTTFDLTANELKAALVLVREPALNGMGGQRPSDLDNDPYTWCDAQTLINAGWSKTRRLPAHTVRWLTRASSSWTVKRDTVSTAGYQYHRHHLGRPRPKPRRLK
jgi:hypothetical protein